MKYYLETNALRALGNSLGQNPALLSESYTSLFSLFELAKGIGHRGDSSNRLNILSSMARIDLNLIDLMPFEIMRASFSDKVHVYQSEIIKEKLSSYLSGNEVDSEFYDGLVSDYEKSTLSFQEIINNAFVKPKPEQKTIRLSLDAMFAEPEIEVNQAVKNLPSGVHTSRIFMEMQKLEQAPAIYRALFDDADISDQEVLDIYNNRLNLFFFSGFAYTLKKNCLRESGSKNDWLDILHSVYLFSYDTIMVSDDRIFESILPDINVIKVDEFRGLI